MPSCTGRPGVHGRDRNGRAHPFPGVGLKPDLQRATYVGWCGLACYVRRFVRAGVLRTSVRGL
jgi:hypothetical protein